MKLSLLAITLFSGIISATANTFVSYAKPVSTLTTIQSQLLVTNETVYFGDAKYSTNTEPLILTYPGGKGPGVTGGMSYTSFHSSQTGWQTFYIYPNDNKPIGFTTPHSAAVPTGAEIANFTVSTTDKYLRYKTFDRWYACTTADTPPGTYQVYYYGADYGVPPTTCVRIDIKTYGYGDCSW